MLAFRELCCFDLEGILGFSRTLSPVGHVPPKSKGGKANTATSDFTPPDALAIHPEGTHKKA